MQMFLPSPMLSIDSFTNFLLPTPDETSPILSNNGNALSGNPPMIDITHATLIYTLSIPTANDLAILRNKITSAALGGLEIQSLSYPVGPQTTATIPIWTIDYWMIVHAIVAEQEHWKAAVSWINEHDQNPINHHLLRQIPWKYTLPSSLGGGLSAEFRPFCSTQWLSDHHMDMMLVTLQTKIAQEGIPAMALRSDFNNIIISSFRHYQDAYPTCNSTKFVRTLADDLKAGKVTSICFIIGVQHGTGVPTRLPTGNGDAICNHWVALVVDVKAQEFRYGDPLQMPPPQELCNVMGWWISTVVGGDLSKEPWKWTTLPCAEQTDGYSCSILAINCLTHHYIPMNRLLAPELWLRSRLDMLSEIVKYLEENVSQIMEIMIPRHLPTTTGDQYRIQTILLRKVKLRS